MSLDLFQTSFNDSVDQQKASPDMQVRKPKIPSWYTNIELKPGEKYKVFNIDHEKLSDFFHIWANETKFAFSVNVQTCTSEKDPKLVGLSLCWSPTVVYYLDIQILKTRHPSVIEDIQNIFESFDEDVIQIAFCIKDQFKWMLNSGVHGVTTSNNWQDPMIASWLMDPDNIKQGLFSLVEHYCSEHLYLFQDTKYDWDVNRPSYTSVSSEKVCCVESIASYILMLQLEEQLSGMNMWQHFTGVEMPHMYCVALLELNGIEVDNSLLKRYRLELHSASLALQEKAWKILGRKF
uniref:Uncharacterized protein n=1 Tax=Ciona intestinalis TaxID=7719 RepID=F6RK78_CIOIN